MSYASDQSLTASVRQGLLSEIFTQIPQLVMTPEHSVRIVGALMFDFDGRISSATIIVATPSGGGAVTTLSNLNGSWVIAQQNQVPAIKSIN